MLTASLWMYSVAEFLQTKAEEQQAAAVEAVFPVELKIMPTCIFNAKDPIILGCSVEAGIAKVDRYSKHGIKF